MRERMRDVLWAILASAILMGCGSVGVVHIQVARELNPMATPGGGTASRSVKVKLFLLEQDAVTVFDNAMREALWPAPGVQDDARFKLLAPLTIEPDAKVEPIMLTGTTDKKYTHLGVTANYPDEAATWRRSFPIDEVRGRALCFFRSEIGLADKGTFPPAAGNGR